MYFYKSRRQECTYMDMPKISAGVTNYKVLWGRVVEPSQVFPMTN